MGNVNCRGHTPKMLLLFGLITVLATGCFQPASNEPQQPTIGRDMDEPAPLPATVTPQSTGQPTSGQPPAGQPTEPPIAQTTTALAATMTAEGVGLPTQSPGTPSWPGATPTFDPLAPTPDPNVPTLAPTPTGVFSPPTPAQPDVSTTDNCTHTVQVGENLFRIALRYDTTIEAISELNGITDPDNVVAGTVLRIPGCTPGQVPGGGAGGAGGGRTYIVQAGDTLYGIARRFGVDMQSIIDANPSLQANPNQLLAGQEIVIP